MPATAADQRPSENRQLADRLTEHADLLERIGDGPFRIRAYREAARMIAEMAQPLRDILEKGGMAALVALPKIGTGIASALSEIMTTGRWAAHDRLRGDMGAAGVFASLPGIGPRLAARLAEEEDLETLEELETALQPGGRRIAGFGPRRRQAVLAQLAQRLGPLRRRIPAPGEAPPVELVLAADASYRRRAAAGELFTIAPRRFNPEGRDWLPILHETRKGWGLTLMFSNTALAHRLGRTHDWVVVQFHRGQDAGGRCTVVTETRGPMQGKRVIRGREDECAAAFAGQDMSSQGIAG